ncbi:MAG: ABC transporter permease [Bacteriovoracaceae bacterium]|nr:ABC transporter permease [Bacteriovoracaceae bacterium]
MPNISHQEIIAISFLTLFVGIFSWKMGWSLHRPLWISTLRCLVQLSLLGYVLGYIFQANHPAITLFSIASITVVAAIASSARLPLAVRGQRRLNFVALICSTWPITLITLIVLQQYDLTKPTIIIPLLGLILGHSLNGITLGVERFTSELNSNRAYFISLISFGATPYEASQDLLKNSIKVSITPVINSMSVAGIVTVPGMMTGQIMSNVSPIQAALYQYVIMVAVSSSIFVGSYIGIKLTAKQLFKSSKGFDFLLSDVS